MDIIEKEISKEAELSMKFEDGRLLLSGEYEGAGGGATVAMFVKPEYLLRQLAEIIPGKVDDLIIEGFIAALT